MTANALGKIFKVEKQLGRGDQFEIFAAFSKKATEEHIFHHEECDGLGALLRLSRKWQETEMPLPGLKLKLKKETLWPGLTGLFKDLKPHKTLWKELQTGAEYTPQFLARRVVSKSSTATLLATAAQKKMNLNTLLLWCINQVVCEQLLQEQQQLCHWLLPVNTRRSRFLQCDTNHTSSIGLHFEKSLSIQELFENYKKTVNPWQALGNEKLTELLGHLSEKNLLALARLRGSKNSWIGSFSNLGRWDFPEKKHAEDWPIHISIAPPAGTPCFPVGVGVITWQGHLSISLRLHAGLCTSNIDMPDLILNAMMKTLEDVVQAPLSLIDSSQASEATKRKITEIN